MSDMTKDEFDATEFDNHLDSLLAGWKRYWGKEKHAREFVQETERAVAQLKQIIEQHFEKPKVTREWVNKWKNRMYHLGGDEAILIMALNEMLSELGVEIVTTYQ